MSVSPQGDDRVGSAPRNVHARIASWAFVRLQEHGRAATMHIVGYIAEHQRLGDDAGEPYVGSDLSSIDLKERKAVNRRGRLIELVGDPLPPGDLPHDIRMTMRRASTQWRLPDDAAWERVELSALVGFGADQGNIG